MVTWGEFAAAAPELAGAGERLFGQHEVAFLATVRRDGAPRIHPVVPVVSDGGLYLFVPPWSPKCGDLRRDARYALHAMLGDDDEELVVRGSAGQVDDLRRWREVADRASFPVKAGHLLFALSVDTCLWGKWEHVGQPNTRAVRRRWPEPSGSA
jgi:hypothetical protein